jgi:hypothetical protein
MNDSDIKKMFENINPPVSSSLESRILSSSSKALRKGCLLKKTIRRTFLTAAILLIGIGAFIAGQSHQEHKIAGQMHTNTVNQDMIAITVHKDFLAWVDAGHFFNQIKMTDKATEAFNNAISLLPKTHLNAITLENQTDILFCNATANEKSRIVTTISMVKSISN